MKIFTPLAVIEVMICYVASKHFLVKTVDKDADRDFDAAKVNTEGINEDNVSHAFDADNFQP